MAASEEAVKQRILKHMNNDHRDSVQRFIEHYNGVSRLISAFAELKDIQLDRLVITAAWKDYSVPISPTMDSFKNTRERVVEMDRTAIEGLGRSSVTIKEYRPPKGFQAVVFAACVCTLILFSRKANVEPGSYLYQLAPGFASFCARIRPIIIILSLLIHIAEVAYMTTVLKRHSVPLFSRLWFTWTTSNFIEGFGAFQRIRSMVEEKKLEAEKRR